MKSWKSAGDVKVRKAHFAGKFYPQAKKDLQSELQQLFTNSKPIASQNQLQAIVSPHAGYVFSGAVAAAAFNQISENSSFKRVFVIASSHQYYFKGAAVFQGDFYETPLGKIKIDTDLCTQLLSKTNVFLENNDAHIFEHSLEVQLPFLQTKLNGNYLLIPIIIGTNSYTDCKKIAELLKPFFNQQNLFVISTDFSHYPNYEIANKIDLKTADAICENNPDKLIQVLEENKQLEIENLATCLCGWSSVLTLLHLTQNKDFEFKKIKYQNSGDANLYGRKNEVVGYWALAIYNKKEESLFVTENEKTVLLQKARNAIVSFIKTGKRNPVEKNEVFGILNEKAGVFVSIYVNEELRGCIGGFPQDKVLNELVQNMAVSAACDQRFENLELQDLENMELEISVISPLKKIHSKNEIELGKHGIYIKYGLNSGTFLPQVATKTGWNVDEFLGHCARDKAGLSWNGWEKAELYIYEAFIFKS